MLFSVHFNVYLNLYNVLCELSKFKPNKQKKTSTKNKKESSLLGAGMHRFMNTFEKHKST